MPYFIKRLEVDNTYLYFYFNRIYTADGIGYYISVVGKDRKATIFHLVAQNGEWKLLYSENCPDWLVAMEKDLGEHIKSHISKSIHC